MRQKLRIALFFILLFCSAVIVVKVQAAELWVDAKGSAGAKKTIPEALSLAKPGDTVRVLPGVYGAVRISKSVRLIAMRDRRTAVNPTHDPANAVWPVVIDTTSGDAIANSGAASDILIEGFFIRRSGFNGIHIMGSASLAQFRKLCQNVTIAGNKVHSNLEDGIKVHQCSKILVEGNQISKWNLKARTPGEIEHAIDFVAVANSTIQKNKIVGEGIGVGITVKAGSINVKVLDNVIEKVKWAALSAGEPSTAGWAFRTSYSVAPKYYAKNILISGNSFGGNLVLWACQNCSVIDSRIPAVSVISKNGFESRNVCVAGGLKVTSSGVPASQLKNSSFCQTKFAEATLAQGSAGWDAK